MERFLQCGAEARRVEVLAHVRESALHRVDERPILVGERPRARNLTEAAEGIHEGAVREVAPGRDEIVVVAADEIGPREVGVLRLRPRQGQVEPKRVRLVSREEVVHVDHDVSARGELPSLHREELARDDVVGKLQRLAAPARDPSAVAVPQQDRRPDRRVEDDVVLAHEVEMARRGILPEVAPRLGPPDHRRPLDGRREIADHRVEPHVHPFVGPVLPARERDRHAPVDVACDRPRLQVGDVVEREVADVRPPVRLLRDPARERFRERR